MKNRSKNSISLGIRPYLKALLAWIAATLLALVAIALILPLAHAQDPGASGTGTRASAPAAQAPAAGVPLAELAPGSPDSHVVQRGDTLWAVASRFLRSPWRWRELWGMNRQTIGDPHLIYPGQRLVLERQGTTATLRVAATGEGAADPQGATPAVRMAPRVRIEWLSDAAVPTLEPHLIEPFLAEPLVVDEDTLAQAPRIVAAPEGRVLITRGDRAYARGPAGRPLAMPPNAADAALGVFRDARVLRDPSGLAVLGYEARFVGRATLLRGETLARADPPGALPVPATLEIISAREEIRIGDRLVPEPPRPVTRYSPRAPQAAVAEGRIIAMHGDAVGMAGQNQVVVINRGTLDGVDSGHVLAILKDGIPVTDRSLAGSPDRIRLPDERNGLLMVFRPFSRLSYALILETRDGVAVGDRITHPR